MLFLRKNVWNTAKSVRRIEEWTYTKLSDQKRKSHQALSSGELKKESILSITVENCVVSFDWLQIYEIYWHLCTQSQHPQQNTKFNQLSYEQVNSFHFN